jgi:Domain of unknown function (DUF4180)
MCIDDRDGIRVLHLDVDGPVIATAADTSDLIGNPWFEHVIAVPVRRLDPAFFHLQSRLVGEMVQKVVTYRLTLAALESKLASLGAIPPGAEANCG